MFVCFCFALSLVVVVVCCCWHVFIFFPMNILSKMLLKLCLYFCGFFFHLSFIFRA